jgi:NAD(P)-dependent dehydrogenase (short-subunit alcohol dehydrogenase family)
MDMDLRYTELSLTDIDVRQAMWDLIDEELGKKNGAQKGETIKKYTQALILLGRTSVPNDVASLVSFLGSKDSDYMTGQT